jgi:DNA/RNA endonuclease G (NUC1)
MTLTAIVATLSLPKVLYTFVLLAVIVLFGTELYRLWLDRTLHVRAVGPDDSRTESLVRQIVDAHSELRHKFATVDDTGEDGPWQRRFRRALRPDLSAPIENSRTVLSDVTLEIQKLNVTDILARLRKWIGSPREACVTLTSPPEETGQVSALMTLKGDARLKEDGTGDTYHFAKFGSQEELAFDIACTLIWREAARQGGAIASVPRDEFCFWSRRWSLYQDILAQVERHGGFAGEKTKLDAVKDSLRNISAELGDRIDGGVRYPRFFDLRASVNLLDFRLTKDVEERKKPYQQFRTDRYQFYARTNLPLRHNIAFDELKRVPAFQQLLVGMRPALPLTPKGYTVGNLKEIDEQLKITPGFAEDWDGLLKPREEVLKKAALATGAVLIRGAAGRECMAMHAITAAGFVIAKNIVVTADYVLSQAWWGEDKSPPLVITFGDEFDARFFFTDTLPDSANPPSGGLKILRAYVGQAGSGVVYLQVDGHDPNVVPPITIDRTAELQSENRDTVAILGFPSSDERLPEDFISALLGKKPGVKRVMPGLLERLLAGHTNGSTDTLGASQLTVDASTTAGVGGGPVIDLATGALIGLSHSGLWDPVQFVKLAYAVPVSQMLDDPAAALAGPAVGAKCHATPLASPKPGDADPGRDKGILSAAGYDPAFLGTNIALPPAIPQDAVLPYPHFTIIMDSERHMARLAAINIDGASLVSVPRTSIPFTYDSRLAANKQLGNAVYESSDFDRGNIVRRSYVTWGPRSIAAKAALATQLFPTILPQHRNINQRAWLDLEDYVQTFAARQKRRVTVFAGPVLDKTDPEFRGVKIPQAFWKIVVATDAGGRLQAAGFLIAQEFTRLDEQGIGIKPVDFDPVLSRIPIKQIEIRTGLTFPALVGAPEL